MNKTSFIPNITKISIPNDTPTISKMDPISFLPRKLVPSTLVDIRTMIREGRLTEECQDRLDANSKNMKGMILCMLLIILVLLANCILLYGDFEPEDSNNSGVVLWPDYNTKPASYLRPNIVPSQHQPTNTLEAAMSNDIASTKIEELYSRNVLP